MSIPTGPRFAADVTRVPDLQPWGRAAEALCAVWYPRVVAILGGADDAPPGSAPIVFEAAMDGIAYTSGAEIHIAAEWVRAHPHDFGMVVHELTHVVQRYPGYGDAGWLVEGIADYVRLRHFEPGLPRRRIDAATARHTDGYQTTAAFLIHLEQTRGADVVPRLHAALRRGRYRDELFRQLTGTDLRRLWSEFLGSEFPGSEFLGPGSAGSAG